jgi:hypothetical protein
MAWTGIHEFHLLITEQVGLLHTGGLLFESHVNNSEGHTAACCLDEQSKPHAHILVVLLWFSGYRGT